MNRTTAIALCCGLAASLLASAQPFNNVYGLNGDETAYGIAETRDGGTVTVGTIRDASTAAPPDILVVKYDPAGNIVWSSRFGGPGNDIGWSIQQTTDGGYIIGAETDSQGPLTNLALLRLDPVGGYMWSWVYEGDTSLEDLVLTDGVGVGVRQTQQGTYVLTGRKRQSDTNQMGVLIHAAPAGNPIWNFRYGDARVQERTRLTFTDVKVDRENTFYVSGTEIVQPAVGGPSNTNPVMFRINGAGGVIFAREYITAIPNIATPETGTGDGLDIFRDGTIVMDGRSDLATTGTTNIHAIRTDPAGIPLWYRTYLRYNSSYRTCREDFDGRVAMAGQFGPPNSTDALLLVADLGTGMPLFARGYNFLPDALGMVPTRLIDGYALTGPVNLPASTGYGMRDIEQIRTGPAGFVGCLDWPLDPQQTQVAMSAPQFPTFVQSQVGTFWQGQFRRVTLREAELCRPCPPCAADFNNDGGIDGADVNDFFDAWGAGVPCADVNNDGGIDGADVQHFFTVWQNGGC